MIIAIDVHYRENFAKSISIEFENWDDSTAHCIHEVLIDEVEEYIPGQFYKRELPCILAVLEKTEKANIDLIVVDGYVFLDNAGKYGLGAYLYEELDRTIPIIGVAKKKFISNTRNVVEVLRGKSKNPLYITSIGIPKEKAAELIQNMHGEYRFPTLLKVLDQHTKA